MKFAVVDSRNPILPPFSFALRVLHPGRILEFDASAMEIAFVLALAVTVAAAAAALTMMKTP
jgi:hypothetical protein